MGIFIVGLVILLPDKKRTKKSGEGDIEASFYESAADSTLGLNLNEKLDGFIDELSENVTLAGSQLDLRIRQLASLQEEIAKSLVDFGDVLKKAGHGDEVKHLPQKHKDVLALQQKGLNVSEIATRLNIGKGEVELILSLYEAGDTK